MNMRIKKQKTVKQGNSFQKAIKKYWMLYLMFVPVALYYIIFSYVPMAGITIAFKDYNPMFGFLDSPWVGLQHFKDFFNNYYFFRLLKNTLVISVSSIVFLFPAPIIFALLLNEIRTNWFKRGVQTVVYLPHFISLVVLCGMIRSFTDADGIITNMLVGLFGIENKSLLLSNKAFIPVYILSDMWQSIGWSSIIYTAALSNVDEALYEAATIDGANRLQQTIHVTIPGIASTVVIMLILRLGSVLGVGYEKLILLYSPIVYDTADVISTFVYRRGLLDMDWSYSSAVGLFNSVVNFSLLMFANWFSRKVSETSLW